MGSTDSIQDIILLYPIQHAMIPSLGIMSSQGDRPKNKPGAHNLYGPRTQEKSNSLEVEIIDKKTTPRPQATGREDARFLSSLN